MNCSERTSTFQIPEVEITFDKKFASPSTGYITHIISFKSPRKHFLYCFLIFHVKYLGLKLLSYLFMACGQQVRDLGLHPSLVWLPLCLFPHTTKKPERENHIRVLRDLKPEWPLGVVRWTMLSCRRHSDIQNKMQSSEIIPSLSGRVWAGETKALSFLSHYLICILSYVFGGER